VTAHPRPDLSALIDGALSPARAAELRAHLAGCPDCRAEVARLQGALVTISALARAPDLPPYFQARLEARLREERERPRGLAASLGTQLARLWQPRALALVGGVAALLLAVAIPVQVYRRYVDRRAMLGELELLRDYETASAVDVDTPEDVLIVAQLDRLEREESRP